jgi:hypothetical protein
VIGRDVSHRKPNGGCGQWHLKFLFDEEKRDWIRRSRFLVKILPGDPDKGIHHPTIGVENRGSQLEVQRRLSLELPFGDIEAERMPLQRNRRQRLGRRRFAS